MKKMILILVSLASFKAIAISTETLTNALNSSELKDRLANVSIDSIEQVEAYKCPECFLIKIRGQKPAVGSLPETSYELQFTTERDFFSPDLKIEIKSETK